MSDLDEAFREFGDAVRRELLVALAEIVGGRSVSGEQLAAIASIFPDGGRDETVELTAEQRRAIEEVVGG